MWNHQIIYWTTLTIWTILWAARVGSQSRARPSISQKQPANYSMLKVNYKVLKPAVFVLIPSQQRRQFVESGGTCTVRGSTRARSGRRSPSKTRSSSKTNKNLQQCTWLRTGSGSTNRGTTRTKALPTAAAPCCEYALWSFSILSRSTFLTAEL